MEINSGAGGTESLDWAAMLLRMYMRWGEANGYQVKVVDLQDGEEVGVKSATLEFVGEFAYGYLKSESGVHRLVRPSPFNANNKRQTTFASVFVSPAVDDTIEIVDQPRRHRMGHLPQRRQGRPERQQGRNRRTPAPPALGDRGREHRNALADHEQGERAAHPAFEALPDRSWKNARELQNELEGQKKKIEWGSQIRSYALHPDQPREGPPHRAPDLGRTKA